MKILNLYVVSYLPKDITKKVLKISNILSEKCHTKAFRDMWEPHITVGSGLWVPENSVNKVLLDFENLTKGTKKNKN